MTPLESPKGQALFRKGLELYQRGRYWHAHEVWEDLWRASPEPDRTFLKALIQIAAAMIHIEKGHWRGVRELLERVYRYLSQVPDKAGGLDIRDLRAQVQRALHRVRALEQGRVKSWDPALTPVLRPWSTPSHDPILKDERRQTK